MKWIYYMPSLNSIEGMVIYPLICFIFYQFIFWLIAPYFVEKEEDIEKERIKMQGQMMRRQNLKESKMK
jgi:fructose-specific phosphotransferase system IIC component